MKFGLDGFTLKIIALIAMIIDHVGAFLFPEYLMLRAVGRIAFPIFAFLAVEGFFHTADVKKYMMRLAAFAFISEIPFDLVTAGKVLEFEHQNVFFTLLLGVMLMYFYGQQLSQAARIGCVILLLLPGDILRTDYGGWGVMMIFCFYIFREKMWAQILSIALINVVVFGYIQAFAVLALLPICLYNGERGKNMKYFFYAAYPVHLLLIYLMKSFI